MTADQPFSAEHSHKNLAFVSRLCASSAKITVFTGATLATGTVIWSNPGNGSGVACIVPAVPSSTGVADVFALQGDGSVQAITASGITAWIAQNVNVGCTNLIPDFQGGLVVNNNGQSIYRLDGMTGQPQAYPGYTSPSGNTLATPVVHTDGTIFTIDGNLVVAINPSNGQSKFNIQLENSTSTGSGNGGTNQCTSPLPPGGSSNTTPPIIGSLIIAGDGYAYVPYRYDNIQAVSTAAPTDTCGESFASSGTDHLHLMRVGSAGDSYEISLGDWQWAESGYYYNYGQSHGSSGFSISASSALPNLITNADKGVLASYELDTYPEGGTMSRAFYLATTSGNSVTSNVPVNLPGQAAPVQPILQRQDGNFVGTVGIGPGYVIGTNMIAFTPAGAPLQLNVPNDAPEIATSNNGVIGASGTMYDQNGNVTGQTPPLTPSPSQSTAGQWPGWLANVLNQSYSVASGAAAALASAPITYAPNYAALSGGNSSTQGTAIQQVQTNQAQGYSKQLPNLSPPVSCDSLILPLTPTCGNINAIELFTAKSPAYIFQNYLQTFAPVADTHIGKQLNAVMYFNNVADPYAAINVTSPGQILQISLEGLLSKTKPFFVMTERVDAINNVISVVTLQGHPLAGWRYWRVYSIGANDVVVETGGYDQPGSGLKNFAGYYLAEGDISLGWQQFMQYIQQKLNASLGSSLNGKLGGIHLKQSGLIHGSLSAGYWDYPGDFTSYILNNVCQSSSCN